MSKIIIVGAGINGVSAAIELKKRGHKVILVDPGPLPHPLAASTDISKAVRAAYGADEEYTDLAVRSIKLWREWNKQFGAELYHEVGVMFVRREEIKPGDFEYESFKMLEKRGRNIERMNSLELWKRFPAWRPELYRDGVLELEAGYAESGRVVATLIRHAKSLGVELREGVRFVQLDEDDQRVKGIVLEHPPLHHVIPSEAKRSRGMPKHDPKVTQGGPWTPLGMTPIAGDVIVMAVGAWTPYLLPFTKNFFRATGQPVFHLKPQQPELFAPERFPVFGADITTTGYYGFPLNREGVVKIANHGPGREMSPDSSDRVVTAEEERNLREFLSSTFPALADAPIVYTRVCMYCDTHDGNFWIARDPEREGLLIAAGDCGHGFKFAPVLGQIISDAVEEKSNPLLKKFRWRSEVPVGAGTDAARFQGSDQAKSDRL
jgi:glycine/D-amino acid oxidase-like deaminating enzyme